MPNVNLINGSLINGGADGPIEISMSSSLLMADTLTTWQTLVASEGFTISDTATINGTFVMALLEGLTITDTSRLATVINLAEGFTLTGESTADRVTVLEFVESLMIEETSTTSHRALFAIAEAFAVTDDLSVGFAMDFLAAIGITDTSEVEAHMVLEALESFVMTDTSVGTARIMVSNTEQLVYTDSLVTKGTLVAAFTEGFVIGGTISTPEGTYDAWVINAETRAPYQYNNFPFNSYALIDGTYYGVADDGLYSLDGDTDDGAEIDATIKTGLMNLGSTLFKHVPRGYIGYSTDGKLLFNTITTENGNKIERWYELPEKTADDVTNARIKMARGVKSVYWQFEVTNVAGSDFDIDDFKLLPVILKRRH